MKYIAALTCLLLTSIAPTAFAMQGNDCAARSNQVKPAEREAFMESCLAKAGAPANVQEEERKHKSALCEQNAKNKHLQGNDKSYYQSNCMTKNEAAVAAQTQPNNVIAPSHKSASADKSKNAPHKAAEKKQVAKKEKKNKKGSKKAEPQSASTTGLLGNS